MTPAPPWFVAQARDYTQILIWSLVLIGVLLVLFLAVSWLRRWMTVDDAGSNSGFTLSDLRRMHKEGHMSDEEFEKAKALLVGQLKQPAEKPPERDA